MSEVIETTTVTNPATGTSGAAMTETHDSVPRDIFLVSNSVDELGGITSWSHQMARIFSERGHTVHVVGIVPPPRGGAPTWARTCRTAPRPCTTCTRPPSRPSGA